MVARKGHLRGGTALVAMCLTFLVTPIVLSAQDATGSIRGRITDSLNIPVPAASITVVGTRNGTSSDETGAYVLRAVPAGTQTIRVVRIGFSASTQTVQVAANGEVTANIVIARSVLRLEEVVTTATGEQSRRAIGNVIATVKADSIARVAPVTTIQEMLTARVPGLQVVQGFGMTGGATSIRIRGINSFTLGNEPLWIIDGVRMTSGGISTSWTAGNGNSTTGSINPDDIESLDIIKGPSAAALYGTQAANGVIVIRTKRGRAGRTQWRAYTEQGRVEQPAVWQPNYRSWGRSRNATTGVLGTTAIQCRIANRAAGTCVVDSLTTFNPLLNKETTPFQEMTPRQVYGMSASGGTDAVRFFVSAEREAETGPYTMPDAEISRLTTLLGFRPKQQHINPNQLTQYNIRGNFSGRLSSKAEVTVSTAYTDRRLLTPFNGSFFQGIGTQAVNAPGFRNQFNGYSSQHLGDMMMVEQPELEERFIGSSNATWTPLSWLSTRATLGLDWSYQDGQQFTPVGQGTDGGWGPPSRTGGRKISRGNINRYSTDVGATATYNPLSSITTRTTLGFQWFRTNTTRTDVTGYGLPPVTNNINSAAAKTAIEAKSQSAEYGLFVETQVAHRDVLYLTLGARADHNNTFGRDADNTIYPRAGLSYAISDEGWFPKHPSITSLRLRTAWGRSGIQPGATTALSTLASGTANYAAEAIPTLRLSQNGNPGIRPEIVAEVELGFDLGVLNDRINVEATYFNKQSKDGLVTRNLPPSLGAATTITDNLGKVSNIGAELALDVDAIRSRNLSWNFRLSGSHIKNKIVNRGGVPVGFGLTRSAEGYPIGGFWAQKISSFADANGDGILVPAELVVDTAWSFIGPSLPVLETALSNTIGFFDNMVSITALLDFKGGHYHHWGAERDRCTAGNCRAVNDPTASLQEQAYALASSTASLRNSQDGYIVQGDYLRFREASVAIRLPQSFMRLTGTRDATLVLTGRNIKTLSTKYPGLDPEAGGQAQETNWAPPPLRYWIGKFNFSF